ncbi:helix-turn-helix transcriptional regulator [Parabacteroides sp. PF5-6]|uniref:helix-turn-helix transcriptional regulator n=1 Tax=Parabacteroides sp. PF5-6 TaxID=1742403 RepID=UPI002405804B|nr:helix-turn-helix transcriptional regulator [Parabacteroides sp. PF5-6]MDF9831535.1 AraC-like DNA-binding protein [Parabacteroides sp. PF5-6]
MKFWFLFGLVWGLISPLLWAGKKNTDEEIKRLYGLIETYFYSDPPVGLTYVYALEQEARRQKNIYLQAYAKAKVVEYYYPMFGNDSLFIAAREAEEFTRRHKVYRYLFLVQQTLIQRYTNEGQFMTGLEKARQMLEDTRLFGSYEDRARAVASMANLYKHLERYDEAMECHRESLRLMELSDKGMEAPLVLENYRELAFGSQYLGHYDEVLLYVDSMRISIARAEADGVSDNTESLFIAESLAAEAWSERGELDRAQTALENMQLLDDPDYPRSFEVLRLQAFTTYYQARGEPEKAYAANEELLALVSLLGLDSQRAGQLRRKADLLSSMDRQAEAVSVYREAFRLQMENDMARHNRQVNELRTLYEVDRMEVQAREDALRIRFSRNLSLALAVITTLLMTILLLVGWQSRRMRIKNRVLVRQIHEQERLVAELDTQDAEIRRLSPYPSDPAPAEAVSGETVDELYSRIRCFMQDNQPYIDPLFNWKTLINLLETNERQLRAALKKHLGLTVSEYINRQRLNYAKYLLTHSESTIETIAFDSGFGCRNTFYRLFREHYGLTPDEYRKANQAL